MKCFHLVIGGLASLGAACSAYAQDGGLPAPVPAGQLAATPSPGQACIGPEAQCATQTAAELSESSADLSTGVLSNTIVGSGNVSAISAARYDASSLAQNGGVNMDLAVGDVSSTVVGENNQAVTELFTIDPSLTSGGAPSQ